MGILSEAQAKDYAYGEHMEARYNMIRNGYNSFPPLIVIKFNLTDETVSADYSSDIPGELLPVVIKSFVTAIMNHPDTTRHLGSADRSNFKSIVIHNDIYINDGTTIDEIFRDEGPLEPKFKEGDPKVREALFTHTILPDWEFVNISPYKYTPVDGWEFGDAMKFGKPGDAPLMWNWLFEED